MQNFVGVMRADPYFRALSPRRFVPNVRRAIRIRIVVVARDRETLDAKAELAADTYHGVGG
jgi:hypothetical protein